MGEEVQNKGRILMEDNNEEDNVEKIKEAFVRLSKSLIDPDAEEKSEFDLGIEFDEKDNLTFEEEQEINNIIEKGIDEIAKGLTFIDDEE